MTARVVRNGAGRPVGGHGGRTAPPGGRDGRPALTTGGKCARGSGRVGSGRVGSGRVGSGRVGSGRVGEARRGEGAGDRVFMESVLFMGAFPARRCGARPGFTRSPYNNPLRMTLVRLLGFRKKLPEIAKKCRNKAKIRRKRRGHTGTAGDGRRARPEPGASANHAAGSRVSLLLEECGLPARMAARMAALPGGEPPPSPPWPLDASPCLSRRARTGTATT